MISALISQISAQQTQNLNQVLTSSQSNRQAMMDRFLQELRARAPQSAAQPATGWTSAQPATGWTSGTTTPAWTWQTPASWQGLCRPGTSPGTSCTTTSAASSSSHDQRPWSDTWNDRVDDVTTQLLHLRARHLARVAAEQAAPTDTEVQQGQAAAAAPEVQQGQAAPELPEEPPGLAPPGPQD